MYDGRLLDLPASLVESDAVLCTLAGLVPVGILPIELMPFVLLLDAVSIFEEERAAGKVADP